MINSTSGALALGDVVITSFNHTSAAYSAAPASDAALRLSPFACVKKAEGDVGATSGNGAHAQAGYIGVVVGLGNFTGASNTEIDVQFGGICAAKVFANTNNVVLGSKLFLSDTAGRFGNEGDSANPDTTVAISLGAVTATESGTINVLLFNGPIDGTATALT
jgi:hypothetical protein